MSNPAVFARLSCSLLPGMKEAELNGLKALAKHKLSQGRYVQLCQWMLDVINEEFLRRDSDGKIEPGMLVIPAWEPQELAESLLGAFSMSRVCLTLPMGRFMDEVLLMLIVDSHCVLSELSNTVRRSDDREE